MKRCECMRLVLLGLLVSSVSGCGELPIRDPRVRIVAFGDSATTGQDAPAYPALMEELLGLSSGLVVNEGESGETAAESVDRLASLVASGIYPNAEIWIHWHGGNDLQLFISETDPFLTTSPSDGAFDFSAELSMTLDDIIDSIRQAVQTVREAGIDVVLVTYYPVRDGTGFCPAIPIPIILPSQVAVANEYLDLLNARLRAFADEASLLLVDVSTLGAQLQADVGNYADCNHLSPAGNAQVASLVGAMLESAFPERLALFRQAEEGD
ncbi:MAG: SGNH/GDSL hydrolase family protein [Phycisphaerae bacterium]